MRKEAAVESRGAEVQTQKHEGGKNYRSVNILLANAWHCWMTRFEDRPCSLSSFIFGEGITGSLQHPVEGVHHGRSVGVRQHSKLRCSLQYGKKLRRI